MSRNIIYSIILMLFVLAVNLTASDFPYRMSEEEAWRIIDSVRAEQVWLDYIPISKQITDLKYAKGADYEGSDVLIVYFGLPNNETNNIRVNLSSRIGEFNIDPHPPSVEDVMNFFDTSFVSGKFTECLPGDTLTPLHLYYVGSGFSRDYFKHPGAYWSSYSWADFTEYVYHIRDGRVRKKCELQLEYKEFFLRIENAAKGRKRK